VPVPLHLTRLQLLGRNIFWSRPSPGPTGGTGSLSKRAAGLAACVSPMSGGGTEKGQLSEGRRKCLHGERMVCGYQEGV